MKTKILLVGLVLGLLASVNLAYADDSFIATKNISVQQMEQLDMGSVEGKRCPSLCVDPGVLKKCPGCAARPISRSLVRGPSEWVKVYEEYFNDPKNVERFFENEYNQLLYKQLGRNMDKLIGYLAALSQEEVK